MSIKLFSGLIAIGDILTETYYRKSRATAEAKEELGLDPSQDYNASIGIASVDEYVVMTVTNVFKGNSAIFDLTQFDTPLLLKSLYVDNANQDSLVVEVQRSIPPNSSAVPWKTILTQTFNRNKTPYLFPDAPLPPVVRLKITAKTDIDYMQLAFKPCAIIQSVISGTESNSGGRDD